MPWKTADVDKHAKGLSDAQKKVWVKVANSALARCESEGGANCDAKAIKAATSMAKKATESDTVFVIADLDALTEAEMSHEDVRRNLSAAVKATVPTHPGHYCWIVDVYDEYLIYELETPEGVAHYKRTYAIADDGDVTLGEPEQVKRTTVYVPTTEAAEALLAEALKGAGEQLQVEMVGSLIRAGFDPLASLAVVGLPPVKHTGFPPVTVSSGTRGAPANPFAESAADDGVAEGQTEISGPLVDLIEKVRRDGTVPIKLIDPGWGSSGYYSEEVLKRDGPKVFPAGTKMYVDHPTKAEEQARPERSVKDLAAELVTNATYKENGKDGPGLYADAKVFAPWRPVIEELAPHIGVSIRALGVSKTGTVEGKKGPVIEQLVAGRSVDFVTQAGRGGKVLSESRVMELIESARTSPPHKEETDMPDELKEAQDKLAAAEKERDDLKATNEAQEAELKRLREAELLREARAIVEKKLAEVKGMPDITRERLTESLSKNPPVKEDGAIDEAAFETVIKEAVKAEADYLAKLTGGNAHRIIGMNSESAGGGTGPDGDADKALEESFTRIMGDEKLAEAAAKGR